MNNTLKDIGRNIMSRNEKSKRSRMGHRDNRLLTEMINNLTNEIQLESEKTKFTIGEEEDEQITQYKTVSTQMYNKKEKIKIPDQIDIIKEANKIMYNRSKNSTNSLSSKIKNRNDVINDTREICMKNYMIDLLKSERTLLNDKELAIRKALNENESKFDSDYTGFLKYIEDEKKIKKAFEEKYMKLVNDNKNAAEREKYLLMENKTILDEFEKTIKMILNLKNYAFFVHFVLGEPIKTSNGHIINENNLNESLLRSKDLEKVCTLIIEELGNMESYKNFGNANIFDTSRLTSKFAEMEENVLKILEKKHQINRELKANSDTYTSDLNELNNREKLVFDEYNKIQNEINKGKRFMEYLKNQSKDQISDKDVKFLIMDLFQEADNNNNNNSMVIKRKNDENLIKDLIETLRIKENKIISCITQLEEIQRTDVNLFKQLVLNRKDKNKETKLNLQKDKQIEFEELKAMKANERSNRIIIKGRKIMTHSNIGKKEIKKEKNIKLNSDEDDKYMLYYEDI